MLQHLRLLPLLLMKSPQPHSMHIRFYFVRNPARTVSRYTVIIIAVLFPLKSPMRYLVSSGNTLFTVKVVMIHLCCILPLTAMYLSATVSGLELESSILPEATTLPVKKVALEGITVQLAFAMIAIVVIACANSTCKTGKYHQGK